MQPDMNTVQTLEQAEANFEEWLSDFRAMTEEAAGFIRGFPWCAELSRMFAGIVIPDVVGVYLCEIVPGEPGVDDWLWVIVGDLPPSYITLDDAPNPASALDSYIGAMREWVEAARRGNSTRELIPVNVAPTPQNAERLQRRLDYLERLLLADYADDLTA